MWDSPKIFTGQTPSILSMTYLIPSHFARLTLELYGQRGEGWLENLPLLLDECAARWSLTIHPPFSLSYNYVAPASRHDGTEVVLKLGVPNPELTTEFAALRLYNGQGMVKLLEMDTTQGVMLLERLQPGAMLSTLADDERATAIAAQLMQQLWRPLPPNHPFPTIVQWTDGLKRLRQRFEGGVGPFPERLVETAESLIPSLLASSAEPVLLHGDLHYFNILSAQRQPWLAIDPKGLAGEPAYEIGAWLRNPPVSIQTRPELKRNLARRVDQFAEIWGFDRQRLLGWGMAQAVLSGWWDFEDLGYGWEPVLVIAELLAELMEEKSGK